MSGKPICQSQLAFCCRPVDNSVGAVAYTITPYGGDADANNAVDVLDFGVLVNSYGFSSPNPNYDPSADFNMDGAVNVLDFGILVNSDGLIGQDFQDLLLTASPTSVVGGKDRVTLTVSAPGNLLATGNAPSLSLFCSDGNALAIPTLSANGSQSVTNGVADKAPVTADPGGTTVPAANLHWTYDSAINRSASSLVLMTSAVNYQKSVVVTGVFHNGDNDPLNSAAKFTLRPTNLWVSDLYLSGTNATGGTICLQWDTPFFPSDGTTTYTYLLRRFDNAAPTVLTDIDVTQSVRDPASGIAGYSDATADLTKTYTYQLLQRATVFMSNMTTTQTLAQTIVTPQVVAANMDQTVDSRIDKRYAGTPQQPEQFLDFQFGSRAYNGGLFVGYRDEGATNDNSRKGRSFAQFTFPLVTGANASSNSIPSNRTYLTGNACAYYTGQAALPNTPTPAMPTVSCYSLTNANNAWSDSSLVWSASLPLMQGAASAGAASPAADKSWMKWDIKDRLRQTLKGTVSTGNLLSLAWLADWDTSDAALPSGAANWAYLTKKEYDSALGPRVVYGLGTPVVTQIYFEPLPGETITTDANGRSTAQVAGKRAFKVFLAGIGLGDSVSVHITTIIRRPVWTLVSGTQRSYVLTYSSTTQEQDATLTGLEPGFVFSLDGVVDPGDANHLVFNDIEVRATLNDITVTGFLALQTP